MKRLISILLGLSLAVTGFSQGTQERVIIQTSAFARQINTNETAAQWAALILLGTNFNFGNFALLNGTNIFTGTNTFTGVLTATNASNALSGRFTGNGAAVTNVAVSNLNSGAAAAGYSLIANGAGGVTYSNVTGGTNAGGIATNNGFGTATTLLNPVLNGVVSLPASSSIDGSGNLNLNGYFKNYGYINLDGSSVDPTGRSVAYLDARAGVGADNVLTLQNFGPGNFTAIAGFDDLHNWEWAITMGNSGQTNNIYKGNMVLEGNASASNTNAYLTSPSIILSDYGVQRGLSSPLLSHVGYKYDGTNLNQDFYTATNNYFGYPSLHLDAFLGITGLTVTSSNDVTPSFGLVQQTNQVSINPSNSPALGVFQTGDFLTFNGKTYSVVIGNGTNAIIFNESDQAVSLTGQTFASYTNFVLSKRVAGFNQKNIAPYSGSEFGTFVSPDGSLSVIGLNGSKLKLFTADLTQAQWGLFNSSGDFNIRNWGTAVGGSGNPFNISGSAPDSAERILASGITSFRYGLTNDTVTPTPLALYGIISIPGTNYMNVATAKTNNPGSSNVLTWIDMTNILSSISTLTVTNLVVVSNITGSASGLTNFVSVTNTPAGIGFNGALTNYTITAGANITLTPGNNSLTIAAIGSGSATVVSKADFYEPWKWSNPTNILETSQAWEDSNLNEPAVFTNSTVFGMFYTGGNVISNHAAIGYAYCPTNSDPTIAASWTKVTGPVFGLGNGGEGINAARGILKYFGTTGYFYYAPYTNGASIHTICVATLSGSNTLTKVGTVLTISGDFQVGNCWVDTNAAGTYCMGYEYLDGFNNYVCGLATNIVGPTSTFTALTTNDTSLDVGLGGYSGGTAQRINGVWHNWYHVQRSLPSYIVHAYTANATPTNWTVEPWNPIFVPYNLTTHGFVNDQIADAKAVMEVNGSTYFFYDIDYNGSANNTIASAAASKYSGALSNLVAAGTMMYPRAVHVYGTNTGQSVANTTDTVLAMQFQNGNSGIVYDAVSNCAIALTPGLYSISTAARFTADPSAGASIGIDTNFTTSAPWRNMQFNQATYQTMAFQSLVPLRMKDKVNITVYQASGSSKTINGSDTWSGPSMDVQWVSPLANVP